MRADFDDVVAELRLANSRQRKNTSIEHTSERRNRLILPEVICLFQGLSHASVRMVPINGARRGMAHYKRVELLGCEN